MIVHSCPLCGGDQSQDVGVRDGYHFVRCISCGLRYCDPMPSAEVINAYYADYWVNEKNASDGGRKVAKMTRLLAPMFRRSGKQGGTFLDVGCNTGFACEAARLLGRQATGVDLSLDAIEKARALHPENQFECRPLEALAEEGGTYDFVLCREVIEHLTAPSPFLEALARVVAPGGRLYVTTPDAGHFRVPRDFVSWKEVIPPEHICFFDRHALRLGLERHGLVLDKILLKWKPSLRALFRKA